jgi:hypothetical protein
MIAPVLRPLNVAPGGVTAASVADVIPTEVKFVRADNLARTAVAPLGQSADDALCTGPLLTCAEPSSMSVVRPYRRFADVLRPSVELLQCSDGAHACSMRAVLDPAELRGYSATDTSPSRSWPAVSELHFLYNEVSMSSSDALEEPVRLGVRI